MAHRRLTERWYGLVASAVLVLGAIGPLVGPDQAVAASPTAARGQAPTRGNGAQVPALAAATGTVHAWGYNRQGELGNGTTSNSNAPVQDCAAGQTAPCSSFLTGVAA